MWAWVCLVYPQDYFFTGKIRRLKHMITKLFLGIINVVGFSCHSDIPLGFDLLKQERLNWLVFKTSDSSHSKSLPVYDLRGTPALGTKDPILPPWAQPEIQSSHRNILDMKVSSAYIVMRGKKYKANFEQRFTLGGQVIEISRARGCWRLTSWDWKISVL